MVNIGLLGTGLFAKDAHYPAIEAIDGLNLVAVANRTKSKAEAFAAETHVDQVYDDLNGLLNDEKVDAIDALLPVQFNLATVKKAVAAKKPIAFEKPIAGGLSDARQIVEIAEKSDIPIAVLENFVYLNEVVQLKQLLPQIGNVVTFTYQCIGSFAPSPYHDTKWRQTPEHIGGYISDGGVHQIAILTEVLGAVEAVSGRTVQLQDISGEVDTFNAFFHLKSGAFGSFIYGTSFAASEAKMSFNILGTKGSLVYEAYFSPGSPPPSISHFHGDHSTGIKVDKHDIVKSPNNGVRSELQNFKEAVEKKDKKLIKSTPRKTFHHLAVIAAGILSADKKGEKITVEVV